MAKVILIMTDSQRYDMVNANVNTGLQTPFLDEMAQEGMRFEKAYSTQPVCQPARAAIFTGQFPHSNGCWTNSIGMSADVHTIGQRLTDNKIHAAYIGKWHLDGGDYFGLGKCPDGWDKNYWYDMRNYLEELTEPERRASREASTMENTDYPASFTYAHRCSDRAIDFLKKHTDEDNIFLTVSYDEPHHPCICPREYWEKYENYEFPKSGSIYDTLDGKPDYQKVWAGARLGQDKDSFVIKDKYYFGCNTFADAEIGRVLKAIKEYAKDATVIYTSDHGEFMNAHSLMAKGPAAYDEITHIPFIMCGKGVKAGVVNKEPISHINIAPTILDLFGIEIPKIYAGKSIMPQVKGEIARVNDYVFMEFGRYEVDHDGFGGLQLMRSAYDGRYKLSVNLLSTDELYDLEKDPCELNNLINSEEHYSIIERLHDAILDNMNNTRDPFRGYYWERRPWRKNPAPASWPYTGYTRQSENDYEAVQLDYDTGMPMENANRYKLNASTDKK